MSGARSLANLDELIEQVRSDWNNVGVAVAAVQGSDLIYAGGFGARELGQRAAVTPDTLFQVGSTTKPFTTAALGMLVDEGRLGWDDPMIDHLPDLRLHDPWLTRQLTVRDAVTHRSGIPDHYYPYLAIKTPDEVVRHLRYLPADAGFRDSFRYNNLMYAAAGKVIEAVSGQSWHDFLRERVLTPLAMHRSGTSAYQFFDSSQVAPTFFGSAPGGRGALETARCPDVAMPHGLDEADAIEVTPWVSFDSAAPAGSIVSSAREMANWLLLHLDLGHFGGRALLRADTVRQLHAVQNLRLAGEQYPLDEIAGALGWFRARYHGHRYLAHSGGMLGFPAYVAMLPERKIGVVVLSNGPTVIGDDYKFHRSIAFSVFDRLLGAEPHDWNRDFQNQLRTIHQTAETAAHALAAARRLDTTPLPLERFTGAYEDRKIPSGPVGVRLENGRLTVRFAGAGAFAGYLEHWQDHQFRLRSLAAGHNIVELGFADFSVEPRATISSMSLSSAYFRLTLDRVGD
jgi:CubicO group peptidase (beta-lactamase class C family)